MARESVKIPEEAAKILEIRRTSKIEKRESSRKLLTEAVGLAYKAGTEAKDVRSIKYTFKTVINVTPSDKEWLLKEYNFELRWFSGAKCQIILPSDALMKELAVLQDAQDKESDG